MNKKLYASLFILFAVLALVLTTAWIHPTIKAVSKPIDFCAIPNDGWAACIDFTYKGLYLSWGAESDNFISVQNFEDWNMLWNGSEYDRHISKRYMIQSPLLGDSHYGDCGGWGGICYKYSEYNDTVKP